MWTRTYRMMCRLALGLPVVMFVLACIGASVVLSSCEPAADDSSVAGQPSPPTPRVPLRFNGVPTVRVRLTKAGGESAKLSTSAGYRLFVDGRPAGSFGLPMRPTVLSRANGRWVLGALSKPGQRLEIVPTLGFARINSQAYRGTLTFIADGPTRFKVNNNVNMESYLASVIPKELYQSFHLQAYRAQAVAARTYALYEMADLGVNRDFDVYDTVRSQVYEGVRTETEKAWKAVRSTHGWVLTTGKPGEERIFLSQFSACNGGYTRGVHVIQRPREEIRALAGGVPDSDGQACKRHSWPTLRFSKRDLYRILAARYKSVRKLGRLASVRVVKSTAYGHPIWVELSNNRDKTARVRGYDLYILIRRSGLPGSKKMGSAFCKITDDGPDVEFSGGRGLGHGVGLSQWGAEAKAQRGMTGELILDFYYPGSKRMAAY